MYTPPTVAEALQWLAQVSLAPSKTAITRRCRRNLPCHRSRDRKSHSSNGWQHSKNGLLTMKNKWQKERHSLTSMTSFRTIAKVEVVRCSTCRTMHSKSWKLLSYPIPLKYMMYWIRVVRVEETLSAESKTILQSWSAGTMTTKRVVSRVAVSWSETQPQQPRQQLIKNQTFQKASMQLKLEMASYSPSWWSKETSMMTPHWQPWWEHWSQDLVAVEQPFSTRKPSWEKTQW